MENEMSERCASCGAVLPPGRTCQSIFDECLVLELDPAYGKVHLLTVACFMIQHDRYSDEALIWIEPQLRDNLNGVPVQHIRQRIAKETQQANRTWKVVREAGARSLPKVAWSVTIADVVPFLQDASGYCEQVQQWARATLQEMKAR
jgi:hypothetical protein